MKIAVPVNVDNRIEGHIGQCEYYNVFTISENKEIKEIRNMKSPGGCGCNTDIASVLASDGVKVLLAAGIGGGSTNAFHNSGISVIRGCSGNATEVVKQYLAGLVEDKGSSCEKHQHHTSGAKAHVHSHDHVHNHSHDHAHDHSHGHKCGHSCSCN